MKFNSSQTGFDVTAGAYRWSRAYYPKSLCRWLLQRVSGWEENWILDVGCGPGTLTHRVREFGRSVAGVDLSRAMLAQQRLASGDVPVVCSAAEQLAFLNGSVAGVALSQSLHWLKPKAALAEIRRVVRPGGWLLVCWQDWMPKTSAIERVFAAGYEQVIGHPPRREPGRPGMGEAANLYLAGEFETFSEPLERLYSRQELLDLFFSREPVGRHDAAQRRQLQNAWERGLGRLAEPCGYQFGVRARLYHVWKPRAEACN